MKVHMINYRHEKSANDFFCGLSFQLERGKINALHGKNGVGKTVLLSLLGGHLKGFIEGEIQAEGDVVLVNQRYDQMIVDEFSFADNLRLANMPRFPSFYSSLKNPTFCYSALCQKFHIDPSIPVKKLSGGQRQILSIMMALQHPAPYLLLDEPTATLDEQNACMVFDYLTSISGRTFLIVCHDKELIYRYTNGVHLHLEIDSGCRRLRVETTNKSKI